MTTIYVDTTIMPFGKYKGRHLKDVPAYYLLYLFDQLNIKDRALKEYIKDNEDVLRKEMGEEKRKRTEHIKSIVLNDNSPMPFGKYKDQPMKYVPAKYLLKMYFGNLPEGNLRTYIKENMEKIVSKTIEVNPFTGKKPQ